MLSFALTIALDGISYGMILFIISVGLTVTMGLMRVINLAHGSFAMIGGYVAGYLTQNGVDFYLALLAAAVVPGILGGVAEIAVYRPLYRKGELRPGAADDRHGVRRDRGGDRDFRGVSRTPWYFRTTCRNRVDIGFRTYPAYRLFLIAVGGVIAVVLWYVIETSIYGARLRAAVDNSRMARCVGMNVNVLFTSTFVVGCALAGFGGAIGAGMLSLEPSYALKYVVLFLVVVIVGGEGSFKGSFVAAMALGMIDTLGKYFVTQVAPYLLYAAVFVLLLWRPQGLLPPKSAA